MSDEIDFADIRQQQLLDASIRNIADQANFDVVGSGECAVCGAEVEPVLCAGKIIVGRWCSVECRDRVDL